MMPFVYLFLPDLLDYFFIRPFKFALYTKEVLSYYWNVNALGLRNLKRGPEKAHFRLFRGSEFCWMIINVYLSTRDSDIEDGNKSLSYKFL